MKAPRSSRGEGASDSETDARENLACPTHPSRVLFPFVPPAPRTPAERLVGILDSLCRAVAHHGLLRRLAGPLLVLICGRLQRTATRVARLAARQGKPSRPRKPRKPAARPSRPKPPLVLPRGKLWLVRLIPETAFGGSQLQHLLSQPDMAAFIAETPQMGRLLRPLCRMVGAALPPGIAKPPPRQAAPAAPDADAEAAAGKTDAAPFRAEAPPPPRRRAPGRLAPAICGPPVPA